MTSVMMSPRGAIYLPARAYNAYQQWKDYNSQEVERDMGYAQSIKLNSLRIWLSFHHWLEDPNQHEEYVDHFLQTTSDRGIRIMPVLFECCGVEPTPETLTDKNFATAVCIKSPGSAYTNDRTNWEQPKAYVNWFLNRYGDDERILTIDAINEPVTVEELAFSREICQQVKAGSSRPLTLGSIGGVRATVHYRDWDLDIYQYHYNFPLSTTIFESSLKEAKSHATERGGRPMWVTEWQRVRSSGSGWGKDTLTEAELGPDLASLAPLIHQYNIGSYFWSLMLKPAYLPPQRAKGTFNGLFHEDGAVWSLADARAVANDDTLEFEERQELPDWFETV